MKPEGRRTGPESQPAEKMFHIRLRNTTERIDLTDPYFLKILEQEYATKYLESIGIEPSLKNIANIIKRYPLKNCELQQSRMNGGLHTDTITVIAHRRQQTQVYKKATSNTDISADMIRTVNLKKMRTDLFAEVKQQPKPLQQQQQQASQIKQKSFAQEEKPSMVGFDFNLETMKTKYIFPFNQTFLRKKNNQLKESSDLTIAPSSSSANNRVIFESKIFCFPFTHVKVPVYALKELQTPITKSMADVMAVLEQFFSGFPRTIFPLRLTKPSAQQQQNKATTPAQKLPEIRQEQSYVAFSESDIDRVFNMLKSEEMAKFVGIFLHFSYWQVFGSVSPVQIDPALKHQMFLVMYETLEFFEIQLENKKLWVALCMPMLLLTLKMTAEQLYRGMYPQFFEDNIFVKNSVGNIAVDKILFLVDNLFDQTALNGRFTFLESDFNSKQKGSGDDRKSIRKRIFGVSAYLDFILPDPKDGKARAIMARKHESEFREGILDLDDRTSDRKRPAISQPSDNKTEKECKEKMLNLVLNKLQNKIEAQLGRNQIIRLEPTQS